MLGKRFFNLLMIIVLAVLGTASCTSDADTSTVSGQDELVTPATTNEADGGVVSEDENASTSVPEEGDDDSQGQSEPGAAESTDGNSELDEAENQINMDSMEVYSDSTYHFQITYPSDFVFNNQSEDKLTGLSPMPITAFRIINPTLAESDLGDLEAADLEIRVFELGDEPTLESWLDSAGLLSGNDVKPFQTENLEGSEVCSGLMIGPGCSFFVTNGGYVFQMTPASLEGESIAKTLVFIS
jgi:hypothetical protein